MLRDGLYEIKYSHAASLTENCETVLVSVRHGNILGADKLGGFYSGVSGAASNPKLHWLDLECWLPPLRRLVSGSESGPDGETLKIAVPIDPAADRQTVFIEVLNEPIQLDLAYIGPLPANAELR